MFTELLPATGVVAVLISGATPSLAAITSNAAFREESAVLSFTATTELACDDGSSSTLTTDVFVRATERREHEARTNIPEVHAEIVRRNGCTGEFRELFTPDLVPVPGSKLLSVDSARVNVSLELFEFSTGEPSFLDLALAFDGIGGVTRRFESATRCSQGLTTRTLSNLESRNASVEGAVALDGDELLAGVEYSAQLEDRRTTETTTRRAQCTCSESEGTAAGFPRDGTASPASATVTRTQSESEAANSAFRKIEASVCADGSQGTLETTLSVSGSLSSDGSTGSSQATAFLTRADSCTGEVVVGVASLVDPDYAQRGADSATLNATFDLADPSTGEPLGVLDSELVFTGTAGASCDSSFSVTDSPPGVYGEGRVIAIARSEQESRSAAVSGSVSFDGLELVNGLELAELTTTRQTNIFISQRIRSR